MEKYSIKTPKEDFRFLMDNTNAKGSRVKKLIIDNDGNKAFFKYEGKGYLVSEACSEKMSYEIAKILGYECARIELAKDDEGVLGVLNYLFVDSNRTNNVVHIDAVAYLNKNNDERSQFYTISNIKKTLDQLNPNLFNEFIKIMIFDALVGEQDRHEENWGITIKNDQYILSPLYDNGCNLLRNFKDDSYAENYYTGKKDFNAYIRNSKTIIYKENSQKKYKHFELIIFLQKNYHDIVQRELLNLNKLTNKKIEQVVNKIPNELISQKHKEYIIEYLHIRKNILLDIEKRGKNNE